MFVLLSESSLQRFNWKLKCRGPRGHSGITTYRSSHRTSPRSLSGRWRVERTCPSEKGFDVASQGPRGALSCLDA